MKQEMNMELSPPIKKSSQEIKGDSEQNSTSHRASEARKPSPTLDAAPSFTPAPWRGTQTEDGAEWLIEAELGAWNVCTVHGFCGANDLAGNEESEANARLIAAAPALYDALKKVLNAMEIQEQRDSGVFHLHVDAFRPMWDAAGLAGYAALAAVENNSRTEDCKAE